jgi:hypothetical protein
LILKGKVVCLESGYKFIDGISRVTIRFVDADTMYQDVRIKQVQNQTLEMDDAVSFELKEVE